MKDLGTTLLIDDTLYWYRRTEPELAVEGKIPYDLCTTSPPCCGEDFLTYLFEEHSSP